MASILHKWLAIVSIWIISSSFIHPVYISVTEIEHNAKEKTLEISCKIFTDDFEKTLRAAYHTHVDLLKPSETEAMNKLVSAYISKHLKVVVNGKVQSLQFKGYEQVEDAINSYCQVDNIASVKNISVTDNILYDYQDQQINILHVTVNGKRQSTKLSNPEAEVNFEF